MNIIKRDGKVVKFDKHKIENAILKAMKYGSGVYIPSIA
ncbi:ATP cone domain-containing protein, partial [Fusobacterium ulcerans]